MQFGFVIPVMTLHTALESEWNCNTHNWKQVQVYESKIESQQPVNRAIEVRISQFRNIILLKIVKKYTAHNNLPEAFRIVDTIGLDYSF